MLRRVTGVMLAVVIAMQAGWVFAANPDTGPGCGLGKWAWRDFKNQKNIAPQVLMATTNGTGMNTFAISSATSGCTNDGQVWAQEKVNVFAAMNFENLAQEMAQGSGEHLTSLATLMGIPADRHPQFFTLTQERYTALMDAGDTSPIAMVKALNEAITHSPVLAKSVSR